MKTVLHWISIVLFGLVSLFLIWFGVTYATVTDMLWFHAAAVPESARQDVRPLYLALMNLIGASSAALGVLSAYVVALPLRREDAAAPILLVIVNGVVFGMAALTAEELAETTGSPTSWHIMGVLMTITAVAAIAAMIARHLSPMKSAKRRRPWHHVLGSLLPR